MGGAAFIAGDWGTSNLRLFLCDDDANVLERAEGPGVSGVQGDFPSFFTALIHPWDERLGALPVVLSGMVGSDIGWTAVPHLECPTALDGLAGRCAALMGGRVHVVPGLSCENRLGAPDFMRGEETQVLGAMRLDPVLARGRRLLCLPGTHTKWVALEDGVVHDFLTAPTGELFAALCSHTVLVRDAPGTGPADDGAAFREGLARVQAHPEAPLLHLLFECRSRGLAKKAGGSASFLSGLLVADDVRGALARFGDWTAGNVSPAPSPRAAAAVTLVGTPALTGSYGAALQAEGIEPYCIDGAAAARSGLAAVHATFARKGSGSVH